MSLYLLANGLMPTAAAFVPVTTGTSIKTLMQVVPKVSGAKIVEWGISFDGSAAATPGRIELIETDVGATITSYANADITKYDPEALLSPSDPTTNLIDISSTTKSGYTSSNEGSIAAIRYLDAPIFLPPTGPLIKQFPLGREPEIQLGKFARIRVTFGAAINAYCYMLISL